MESTSLAMEIEYSNNKYTIFIKDKQGFYFLKPFVDKNNKLLSVQNSNNLINCKSLMAVNKIFKNRLWQKEKFPFMIRIQLSW
jgi:hypothetical protein